MNLNFVQWRSLKARVALFIVLIFVASVWSLSFYASQMLREDMQRQLGEQQFSTASFMAAGVNDELSDRLESLKKIASEVSPAMLDNADELQAFMEQRPIFQNLFNGGTFATRSDGIAIADVPLSTGRRGVNFKNRDYMVGAIEEGRPTIGKPLMGLYTKSPLFVMAVPVRNALGKVTGALAGVVDLGKPNFINKIAQGHYGKTGGYFVIAPRDGLIVTATDRSRIMQPLPARGVNQMLDRYLDGQEGYGVAVSSAGVEQLSAAKLIPAAGWLMVATLPTAEAFAPIRSMQQRMLIATVVLSLVVGGLIWWMTSWMLRRQFSPMLAVAKTLSTLAADKASLPEPLPIDREDEIGELIGGFNYLLETVRHREEALKDSEFRWKFAIEGAGDGVWDWNLETGKMLYSPRWIRMLGYAEDELGDSLDDWKRLVRPEDMKKAMIALEAYMDGIEPPPYHTEYQMLCKDGSWKWVLSRGMVVSRAEDGRPLRMIGTHTDITERTAAQDRLLTLSRAVENSPSSVMITDLDGNIEYVNRRFAEVTGYTAAEAIGKNPRILNARKHPPEIYQELWQTILAGREWQGELLNRKKNGDIFLEQVSISSIQDGDGAIAHFVAVKQDITLQRQAEEDLLKAKEGAESANRAKDEFLANITHELRTPLSAVIGFSSLARPYCTDAQQRDYLDKVNTAGKTLSGIIDDLLDLSKIAAGHLEFESTPFSLRRTVGHSRSVISYKAQEKGLQLIEKVDDAVPDVLVGDSLRVEQILLNLLSNAVKFTAFGRVELRVGLRAREHERVCLDIEVEDTGIGLSEESLALMFKPFSQADASMTRKFGGTGLGLAICKHLAELMGGEISVSSREGIGTTFRVSLWLGIGHAGELPATQENELEPALASYHDVRVLVVDDQPFNRDVVKGLLAVVGITPHLAENGQQAADIIAARPDGFDLVLMDVQMPVMDGLTATRVIRGMDGFADLPIIAMTAHTMAHEREKSVAAGMNDHIGKPFNEAAFYRVLAKWIPREKQQRQIHAEARRLSPRKLPFLNGIDTGAGLSLLLGDEVRYRHWLNDFVAEAPTAMQQIRQALGAGRAEQACMTAHTLKGRMGLLGMTELHGMAAALEAAIESAAPSADLLLNLERGVAAMSAEIQSGLNPDGRAAPTLEALPDTLPPGVTPASVTQLIEHLQTGDSDCDRLVADCQAELAGSPWAPFLRRALSHVETFDYDAARSLLTKNEQAHAGGA